MSRNRSVRSAGCAVIGTTARLGLLVALAASCSTPDTTPTGRMTADSLKAIIPALSGWDRGEVTAQHITVPEEATVATTSYAQGGARLELEISDTGGKSSMIESLASMAGSDVNRPVNNGYFKGTMIAGAPAVESWNTVDRLGEITVLVNKRYIIHVGGRGLPDPTAMRTLVEQIPIDRLKASSQ